MKEATSKALAAAGDDRCEYLGLREDPQTCLAFPSPWNCCYHARPVGPVRLEYQRVFCQTAAHAACAVLARERLSALPPDIRGHGSVLPARSWRGLLQFTGILLALVALGAILWRAAGQPQIPAPNWSAVNKWYETLPFGRPAETTVPLATAPVAVPAELMPTAAVLLPASSPVPTLAKPLQSHSLEVPIQVGNQVFVIHRVMGGETFEQLTKQYDTTSEAIRALNRGLTGSLWADTVIVIAPGVKVADRSLPVFETYQVLDDTVAIDQLADMYAIAPAPLRAYNGCEDNCQLVKGDWIIVPHSE